MLQPRKKHFKTKHILGVYEVINFKPFGEGILKKLTFRTVVLRWSEGLHSETSVFVIFFLNSLRYKI